MKPACTICTDSFNKRSRTKVTCECGFEACRDCVKKYLLSQPKDAHCMSCKMNWNRVFLFDSLGRSFLSKEYKHHLENVLLEKELPLMPQTQPYVEHQINIENLVKEKADIKNAIKELGLEEGNPTFISQRKEALQKRQQELDLQITLLKCNGVTNAEIIVLPCPNNKCRGFVSRSLQCSICGITVCDKCNEISLGAGHVCDPDIAHSVKMLRKDSKPCPACNSLIFKIDGCDHMWCTRCHTGFDWKSLNILTGHIENPEYYAFLRQTQGSVPRHPENEWNDVLNPNTGFDLGFEFGADFFITWRHQRFVMDVVIYMLTLTIVEIPKYMHTYIDNTDARIKYLRNQIDKDKLKTILHKRHKQSVKNEETANVLSLFVRCTITLIHKFLIGQDTSDTSFQNGMLYLKNTCNERLQKISHAFDCRTFQLDWTDQQTN